MKRFAKKMESEVIDETGLDTLGVRFRRVDGLIYNQRIPHTRF